MEIKKWTLIWALPLMVISCVVAEKTQYERAVDDAAVVEQKDIYPGLVAVTPDNKNLVWYPDKTRVLVVMWKSRSSYEQFYKGRNKTAPDEGHVTWVTTVPQVQEFAKAYLEKFPLVSKADIDLRLKQYLGLKPQWTYDLFVEMWVDPSDLFRPCTDPEIDDNVCNIEFPMADPVVTGISCYPSFYKNLYLENFRTRPGLPWTGMGYTYDWGSREAPFGASEFILVPGAAYEIKRVVETLEYVKEK